jgi:hypothetical protein
VAGECQGRQAPAGAAEDRQAGCGLDLEQLEETLAILRDADTMGRLASSDAELARGESVSAEELAEVIRRRSADQ